ncbi:MAG: SAM-dependent methyltransferase [Desulfobaccales bacterium]
MSIELKPIGFVQTEATELPRHWSVSNVKGRLVIDSQYQLGLKDIKPGQQIVVLFHFDRSPEFTSDRLIQQPPHHKEKRGVFSICSPLRPNPLGLSIIRVLAIKENVIEVQGIDMLDGTPILDWSAPGKLDHS